MAMTPDKLKLVADHMGHSLAIHTDVYRLQTSILEGTKVARALVALEEGKLTKSNSNQDTNLSTIDLDDLPAPLLQSDDDKEEEGDQVEDKMEEFTTNNSDINEESSTVTAANTSKGIKRKRWSEKEDADFMEGFGNHIKKKKTVSACEIRAIKTIDECQADPCNGHNCINEINSFTCTCSNGWSGTTCNTRPDHCINHECHTGSTCLNLDVDYECQCPSGYSGFRCDVPPVDGEWSSWSSWTVCPIICSNETRTRERTCDNPPPDPYGQNCDGDSTQIEPCNHDPCPECPKLSRSFGHLVSCETSLETGTMACNYTCKDGYDLPKGLDDFELYRCGLETDFTWQPRSTVPKCVGQQRPRSYEVISNVPYGSTVSDQDRPDVVSNIETNTNGADCFNSAFCRRSVTLSNDGDTRKRRSSGTTVTVTFTIDINGTSDLQLEEFEANNTVSEGLQEILDALTYLDSTAQAINNSANTVFDMTVNGVTYHIDSSSLTIEGSTTCGETEVVTDGLCTECPDGTYINGDFCTNCEKGTYQELSGQMSCNQCPIGYTTVSIGSTTAQQCSEIDNLTSISTTPSTPLTSTPTSPTTSTSFHFDEDNDESIDSGMFIVIITSISGVITIMILAIIVIVLVKKFCRPSKVSDSLADLKDYNYPRPSDPPMFSFLSPLQSINGPFKPKLRKNESMMGQRENAAVSISDLEGEIKAPTDFYRPSNTQKFVAPLYSDLS